MIEHRVTEKMLAIINEQIDKMERDKKVDSVFVDAVVDFFETYADRTHHGKEEDVLFRELEGKNMSDKNTALMKELIEEHKSARTATLRLKEAKKEYLKGDDKAAGTMIGQLQFLTNLYPEHIMKEDKIFFPETENHFTTSELDEMLRKFTEFDSRIIHEKYNNLINNLKER
jgi:hemerythrin-like domain-containing protein